MGLHLVCVLPSQKRKPAVDLHMFGYGSEWFFLVLGWLDTRHESFTGCRTCPLLKAEVGANVTLG